MKIPKIIMAIDTAFVDADHRSTYEIGFAIIETERGIAPENIRVKQYYIKPDPNYSYERSLHGKIIRSNGDKVVINNEAHDGVEIKKVLDFLNKAAEKVDCFAAHNAQADHSRLRKLAEQHGISWPNHPWLNTMTLFRKLENSKKGALDQARRLYDGIYRFGLKSSQEDARISLAITLEAIKRNPILLQQCYHLQDFNNLSDVDLKTLQERQALFDELEERISDPVMKRRIDQVFAKLDIKIALADGLDHTERAEFLDLRKSILINQVIIRALGDEEVRDLAADLYWPDYRGNVETLRQEMLNFYECGDGFKIKSPKKQSDEKMAVLVSALGVLSIDSLRDAVDHLMENFEIDFDGLVDKRRKASLIEFIMANYNSFLEDITMLTKPDLIVLADGVGANFKRSQAKDEIAEEIYAALDPLYAP